MAHSVSVDLLLARKWKTEWIFVLPGPPKNALNVMDF